MTRLFAGVALPLLVCGVLVAQQPGATPAKPPAAAPAAAKGDAMARAFVDGDGGRPANIAAAADKVLQGGAEARTKFMALLHAVLAVAPKTEPAPAAKPAPAATPAPAAGTPAAAQPEFPDPIKATMTAAVGGPAAETTAALTRLAADQDNGTAALTRLAERGRAILARCLLATLRQRLATNALFAGQYADCAAFKPEAIDVLLGWVKDPPREATQPDTFRAGCVRALRDIVGDGEATDALRTGLQAGIAGAQRAQNEELFLTLVCALQQFGASEPFDKIKADVEKQVSSDKPEQRAAALSTLANLHYQARQYEQAAAAYTSLVELVEKQPQPPQGMPTIVYNAACSLSLAGKLDQGFAMLEKALQLGQKDRSLPKAMIDSDHDMNNLRADARFQALMERYYGPKKEAPKGPPK